MNDEVDLLVFVEYELGVAVMLTDVERWPGLTSADCACLDVVLDYSWVPVWRYCMGHCLDAAVVA